MENPQDFGGQVVVAAELPVFQLPAAREQDHQGAAPPRLNELQAAHRRVAAAGGRGHGGQPGHTGEHLGGLLQQAFRVVHRAGEVAVNVALLLLADRLSLHQLVDIQAVAQMGGHPAGRGVGLLQKAQLHELGHLIADGSRRYGKVKRLTQRFGADRLACFHIRVHNGRQYLAFSFSQFHIFHLASKPLALFLIEC